jgi:hypothetical protein
MIRRTACLSGSASPSWTLPARPRRASHATGGPGRVRRHPDRRHGPVPQTLTLTTKVRFRISPASGSRRPLQRTPLRPQARQIRRMPRKQPAAKPPRRPRGSDRYGMCPGRSLGGGLSRHRVHRRQRDRRNALSPHKPPAAALTEGAALAIVPLL